MATPACVASFFLWGGLFPCAPPWIRYDSPTEIMKWETLSWTCTAPLALSLAFAAVAQPLQLVSTANPPLTAGGGGGDSLNPILSADGRYVLFASSSNNL